MDAARRIKILRLLNGYTQEAIAALLGISRPSIVVWESGKHPPSTEYVIRLAEMVGVEPGYISYGSPLISCCAWIPAPPDRPQNLSSYIRDLRDLFPALLDENRLNASRFSRLGDGGVMALIGREREFTSLLLARESLANCFVDILNKLESIEMGALGKVTVDSFGEDELSFFSRHAVDFSIDHDDIWQALVKARPGARVRDDVLNILFTSFSFVLQEYRLDSDGIMKLGDFFAGKCRTLPSVGKISSAAVQTEVRDFLESQGCRRRQKD